MNITDIDKFHSVVKAYGGMGSKALFVTNAEMTDVAKAKCREHNILAFSLHNKPEQLIKEALFLLLDNELFNINKK